MYIGPLASFTQKGNSMCISLKTEICRFVHNRDRPEIFQNSLIERTPKAAFRALKLSIKHSRPFPSDLKTDIEVLKARKTV